MTARHTAMAIMALMGAAFFYALLAEDMPNLDESQRVNLPWGLIALYICAMALGGAIAGLLFAGFFGRAGAMGWVRALIGGILVALVAGFIGSALGRVPQIVADGFTGETLVAIGFGFFVVPLAITGFPMLLAIWALLTLAAHVLCKRARAA